MHWKIRKNGKKILAAALALSLLPGFFPVESAASASAAEGPSMEDNGQVIVLYEEDEIRALSGNGSKTLRQQDAESAEEKILDATLGDSYAIDDTLVFDAADGAGEDLVVGVISSDELGTDELLETLRDTKGIRYAEPNRRLELRAMPDWNDSFIKDSWQLGENGINADKAPASKDGDPVVIAVMDTGIAYDHPDIESRMWTKPEGFDDGGEYDGGQYGIDIGAEDDDPYDADGHGTHCAGIIAAAADNAEGIAGVAGKNNIQLMAVKAVDDEGYGWLEEVYKSYDYLIRARQKGVDIRAVNCSFGFEMESEIYDAVIDNAGENGILTIAAAGNDAHNNDDHISVPDGSDSDYVISVAASDPDGGLASYSDYSENRVDVAAPGTTILSTVSYNNYAPYLYDADRLSKTTAVYGEFGGAELITDPDTGMQSVTPVSGSGYDGRAVEGVPAFGASRMYSFLSEGSQGRASLSMTDEDDNSTFSIGNNQKSLRWTIEGCTEGDVYILYFPYVKTGREGMVNAVCKMHTDYDGYSGRPRVKVCDVKVYKNDQGELSYKTVLSSAAGADIDRKMNSSWCAWNWTKRFFSEAEVSGYEYGSYGLGIIYQPRKGGDVSIDISSLAISSADANADEFGRYDVYAGTSMAAPVVSGMAGLIAAARPGLSAVELKSVLLSTATPDERLKGKCLTGARVDFAAYDHGIPDTANTDTVSQPAPSPAKIEINSKTVSAASVRKAIKAAGGNPDAVTAVVLGKNVKKISKSAFRDLRNVRTLVVRTKKLKKSKVRKSLKGSNIRKVKVRVGKKKTNRKYVKKYKKIFTKKNVGRKVKVT